MHEQDTGDDMQRLLHPPTLRDLEFLFVAATVFLAPMNFFRLEAVYFTLADFTAICGLTVMLLTNRLSTRMFGPASSFWMASCLLLVSGLLIGSVANGDPMTGLVGVAQYGFSLLLMPILIAHRENRELLLLLTIFLASLTVIWLHGAYVLNYTPDDLRFVSGSGRLLGLVERENSSATLTAVAIVLVQWFYLTGFVRLPALLAILAVLLYGLLHTGSNTGFFLAAFGTLTLALLSGSLRYISALVLLGSASILVLLTWGDLLLPEIFRERVLGALTSGDLDQAGTFADRMFLVREALDVSRHHLFIGLGMDRYREFSAHHAPVHNTYLLVLAEGGLVSLVGLLGLLLTGVFLGWSAMATRTARWSGVLTLTMVAIYVLAIMSFAHIYARFWIIPLCLAYGFSANFLRPHIPTSDAGRPIQNVVRNL